MGMPPTAPPPHFLASHRRVPRVGTRLLSVLERVDAVFDRLAGSAYNPLYQTGPLVVLSLVILAVTGVYVFLFYSVSHPYESMQRIQAQWWMGRIMRSAHRYAADAAMVFTVVHAVRLFLQGRTWGARALAWISGVVMSAMLLACGWTGFVLVWDAQGHQLALEGARLLDLLPVFPEPIQGQFVSEKSLGTMFFFVNLFAHVGLPLGAILALWIHISRTARTTLFPPRPLLLAVTLGLVLLSMVAPAALDGPARLDWEPTTFHIDWLYSFWLPLLWERSPWWAALFWFSSSALLVSAPWWWRPTPAARPQASTVNERLCEGCRQCYLDCPYEAIQMIPRTLGTGSKEVARVTPDLCVSCGICAGSCDVFRVGPPGRGGRDQLISLRGLLDERPPAPMEIVVFCCTQSALRLKALQQPGLTVIPLECAGNLHTVTLAAALKRGAAGAVVWSCPPRNCQFREGPRWLQARMEGERDAVLPTSVDRSRVLVLDAGPGEIPTALLAITAFRARLAGTPAPQLLTRPRWPGRLLSAGVLLGGLGLAATATESRQHPGATLRLAWRHDVGLTERCVTPSDAEQQALPPHMRRARICERRYPDLHVQVRVDGVPVLDRMVEPGGARKDRAPQVLFDVPITTGPHAVGVALAPMLTAEESAAGAGAAPVAMSAQVDAQAGSIWRVDWDAPSAALRLVPPR